MGCVFLYSARRGGHEVAILHSRATTVDDVLDSIVHAMTNGENGVGARKVDLDEKNCLCVP